MKSALKKSVVSTSISLILASGMAAFAAHAADDVKLKATKTNVAFSDFTPTEYSTKGKPNIIVLTMDDLGYGQLPSTKRSEITKPSCGGIFRRLIERDSDARYSQALQFSM